MKKVKNNALRALIEAQSKGQKELIYSEGTDNELRIKVVSAIPYTKRTRMIAEIVSLNFAGDAANIDDYMSSSLDFARKYTVLKYYTDLKLPTNIDELWLVLNYTTIYKDVVDFVGEDIVQIFNEADKMIDAKVSHLTHKTELSLFLGTISKAMEQFGVSLENIDFSELMGNLKGLPSGSAQELVGAILGNIKK